MKLTEKNFTDAYNRLVHAKQNWKLQDDGDIFNTSYSLLQPVIYGGDKAMLKTTVGIEECRGAILMVCWNGHGSARIFQRDENSLLMERAVGTRSLKKMVINGDEDEANKIICELAEELHAAGCQHLPELIPLHVWFRALKPAAEQYGGILVKCKEVASHLLNDPKDTVALHGDIHYDNVLDSGSRGWIAIDPKGLIGERAFDFANIFCNPDFKTAASPNRLSRQVNLVADEAGLEPKRFLKWVIAWAGLSAAWMLDDGEDAIVPLTVAQIAVNEMDKF
jgi:streptomycin 6-kinase